MVLNEELKMAYELVASLKDENIKLHAEKMNHETDNAAAVEAERNRIVAMIKPVLNEEHNLSSEARIGYDMAIYIILSKLGE